MLRATEESPSDPSELATDRRPALTQNDKLAERRFFGGSSAAWVRKTFLIAAGAVSGVRNPDETAVPVALPVWQKGLSRQCDAKQPFAKSIVDAYLPRDHLNDVDGSCPLIGLPSDFARSTDSRF
jgi:hypothetical protein